MKILLVRLRLIGDVVFTTPILRALRERYPKAHLTYLVETSAAPVVEHNPSLSAVLTVSHSRGWRRLADDLRLARHLRREAFDLVVDLHGGPRSAWLTWATGAAERVGYDVPGRSWMYTRVVSRPKAIRSRHAVENQWDLLAAVDPLLPRHPDRDRHRAEMPVTAAGHDAAGRALAALGVPPSARLTIVHVSAGNPFRRWPEEAFAELAAGLAARDGDRWVLASAGPSDREAASRVIARARALAGPAAARIVSGETLGLPELRALMDRAALYIGGDSGPLHVASTSDVPIVGLYGPTTPDRSAPWRPSRIPTASVDAGPLPCRPCDQRTCVTGDFRCLSAIPAARVLEAAERLLGGPAR